MTELFIQPNWPAPSSIKSYTTLRHGGVSLPPYNGFNLGKNTGDDPQNINENCAILQETLQLPTEPLWIQQTHSTLVLPALPENKNKEADATFSIKDDQICVVLTADCLPILLCDRQGTFVAAVHAGWRGLSQGIIANTLSAIQPSLDEVLAWLGPAISQQHFEVGNEVRDIFIQQNPQAESAFIPSPAGRWLGDLYALARLQLQTLGVNAIYGGEYCTFSDKDKFYSYRRDIQKTGRMASLIWRSSSGRI